MSSYPSSRRPTVLLLWVEDHYGNQYERTAHVSHYDYAFATVKEARDYLRQLASTEAFCITGGDQRIPRTREIELIRLRDGASLPLPHYPTLVSRACAKRRREKAEREKRAAERQRDEKRALLDELRKELGE